MTVYGLASTAQLEFLAVEQVAGNSEVFYGRAPFGATEQQVSFADLIDGNGNSLPSQIINAVVIIQSHEEKGAFVVGNVSNSGFRIARSSAASGPVEVSLVVIET